MSRFNYGNNYSQAPPPNPIYPQVFNNVNAPPPGQPPQAIPGYPGQPQYPGAPQYAGARQYPGAPQYPGQPQYYGQPQYAPQPGFSVYPNPTSMSYPGAYPGQQPLHGAPPSAPTVTPQGEAVLEWIPTTPRDAPNLSNRAVVAGFEGHDHSPLWVIRARYENDLIPGKLAIKHHCAYVAWGGEEHCVQNIEVCCARPEKVRWVETRDGNIPPNAVIGGNTSSGEPLYIGRAREQGSLTPGKVHPSHKSMYISFAGKEIAHKAYEILCTV